MEHELRTILFALADRFAAETGKTRLTMGKQALNDNTFFPRLERGDGFNVKTFDRMVIWFSNNWPTEAAWPDTIERPAPASAGVAA